MRKPHRILDLINNVGFYINVDDENTPENQMWQYSRAVTFFKKEPETVEWIRRFDGTGIFWDIGANIGIYSLYCAALHPGMTIHAFEPMRENYEALEKNVKLNGFNNINCHNVAFGAVRHENKRFYAKNHYPGSSGGAIDAEKGEKIDVISGDYFIAIPNKIPKYIKIDTDSNEWDILQGMEDLLFWGITKSVLAEINDNHRETAVFMHKLGYFVDLELMGKKTRGKHAHNVIWERLLCK